VIRKIKRKPTTPGEILHEEYLESLGLTQKSLADHLGCDIKVINRISKLPKPLLHVVT
jgi:plasmid maintenance system antidote protein VapI